MQTVTIVTGNASKLAEIKRILPADFPFTSQKIDLDEIQSFDLNEIVTHKVKQAYAALGSPVIVEDASAGLDALNGLPGPFIKFFNERLGHDALYQLAKDDYRTTVVCTAAYYDGDHLLISTGIIHGSVVEARTSNGFGFDNVFVLDGHTQTFAEMTLAQKDALSHRGLAFQDLVAQITAL